MKHHIGLVCWHFLISFVFPFLHYSKEADTHTERGEGRAVEERRTLVLIALSGQRRQMLGKVVKRGAREGGAGVCRREYVGVVTDGGVGVCRAILKALGTGWWW